MIDGIHVYIAGPMRGCPGCNFAAFDAARDDLARKGCTVFSPADISRDMGHDGSSEPTLEERQQLMRADMRVLLSVQAIYMLPGWQESDGAKLELEVARACGHVVMFQMGEAEIRELNRISAGLDAVAMPEVKWRPWERPAKYANSPLPDEIIAAADEPNDLLKDLPFKKAGQADGRR